MSSDPKGPEPTPLSAEAARAMTLLVMASRVDSNLRSAVADVETYVAELQREIEGLRAVSEQQQQRAQLAEERIATLKGALEGREAIYGAITAERQRQERLKVERNWKWSMATPGVADMERLMPVMEEVGEVFGPALEHMLSAMLLGKRMGEVAYAVRRAEGFAAASNSHENHGLYAELVQVAACAVAWLEALAAERVLAGKEAQG